MNLPDHLLSTVGPTSVTIERVVDSSPCGEIEVDPLMRTVWIEVAETAAIMPFDRRSDYCVGEVMSFQLEGTPSWNVRYDGFDF